MIESLRTVVRRGTHNALYSVIRSRVTVPDVEWRDAGTVEELVDRLLDLIDPVFVPFDGDYYKCCLVAERLVKTAIYELCSMSSSWSTYSDFAQAKALYERVDEKAWDNVVHVCRNNTLVLEVKLWEARARVTDVALRQAGEII